MCILKHLSLFSIMVALTFSATMALADEVPPYAPDPISLDRTSPSVIGFGNTPGDIYGEVFNAATTGGWDVGGPGPILHLPDFSYGLLPMVDNNDGHSNGELDPLAEPVIYFSGDDQSVGMLGTHYNHQSVRLQAAGDRFVTNGAATPPAIVMANRTPAVLGMPAVPGGPINLLSANQTRYNEIPTISQFAYNTYVPPAGATVMDDMDALELTPFDRNGDRMFTITDAPIYFSLDMLSPSLPGSPADVLIAAPGAGTFTVFAPANTLGLNVADDVDALAVWDTNGDFINNPFTDYAIFSLAPGSPYLAGPDGIWGSLDDFSAADIFVTDFSGINTLYLSANSIGMQFTDNVDAIDVEVWLGPESVEIWDDVPEPSMFLLLAAGALALALFRFRKG